MNNPERRFNQAIDDHLVSGREYESMSSEDEQKICALYWMKQPGVTRYEWLDYFGLNQLEQILAYIAAGDSAEAGKYLAEVLTTNTTDKVRDIYEAAYAVEYPEDQRRIA